MRKEISAHSWSGKPLKETLSGLMASKSVQNCSVSNASKQIGGDTELYLL